MIINRIKNILNRDLNLKELISGSAITFLLKISGMILSYLLTYFLSRKIGADGLGYYNLFVKILTLTSALVYIGLNITSLRYIGQFKNSKEAYKIRILYNYILKLVLPIGIIVGVLIYFNSSLIVKFLNKSALEISYLKIVGLILPFFALNKVNVEFIRGFRNLPLSEFLRNVSRTLLILIFLLFLYKQSFQVISVLKFFTIGVIANWIISSTYILNKTKKLNSNIKSSLKMSEVLKTSFPIMINSVSTILLISMPVFFLYYYTNQKNVGLFSVAYQISMLISLVLVIFNIVLAPKFSELFWNKKYDDLQKLIAQSSMIMFWIALLLCLIITFCSEYILSLFGNDFLQAKQILLYLAIGQLINVSSGSVQLLMNMAGEQKMLRSINIVIVLMSFLSYIVLVKKFVLVGCTIIFVLGVVLRNIISVIYVRKKLNLKTHYIPLFN